MEISCQEQAVSAPAAQEPVTLGGLNWFPLALFVAEIEAL